MRGRRKLLRLRRTAVRVVATVSSQNSSPLRPLRQDDIRRSGHPAAGQVDDLAVEHVPDEEHLIGIELELADIGPVEVREDDGLVIGQGDVDPRQQASSAPSADENRVDARGGPPPVAR